jgi:hypothetical protein
VIQLKFKLWLILSKNFPFLFCFYLKFLRRFYKNEGEFATVNDRIHRGDIVGAKGQPSK